MKITSAVFIGSAVDVKKCPAPDKPEYAFVGRSNVGKSSLINMLTNVKGLAKTSSTPGKTQLINHFLINEQWYLVDLPGYGYAKVSRTQRKTWSQFVASYLNHRENLVCLFVLIDSRIPFQKLDEEMINWLGKNGVPFCLVYTKTDKVKNAELQRNVASMKVALKPVWEELPTVLFTSSETKTGKEELLGYIDHCNESLAE